MNLFTYNLDLSALILLNMDAKEFLFLKFSKMQRAVHVHNIVDTSDDYMQHPTVHIVQRYTKAKTTFF